MLFENTRSRLRGFAGDKNGNFGMITALLAVPLLLTAGSALDVTMATLLRQDLQDVADSAVLAAGSVYDGTNPEQAKKKGQSFLKGYAANLPAGTSFEVSLKDDIIQVQINSTSDNAFMGIVGHHKMKVAVIAEATSTLRPTSVKITPIKASGMFYKLISIVVVRNDNSEEVVGTVEYQAWAPLRVDPPGEIDLGAYKKLYLKMDVKGDGCGLKHKVVTWSPQLICEPTTQPQFSYFSFTLRTDNPSTSHHLFVDGKQMLQGQVVELDTMACGKSTKHAWEDGGGFADQDFFYNLRTVCSPSGDSVRLVR
jgi:Flp pilus assembly protein TadG